jgi:hypothetical protein
LLPFEFDQMKRILPATTRHRGGDSAESKAKEQSRNEMRQIHCSEGATEISQPQGGWGRRGKIFYVLKGRGNVSLRDWICQPHQPQPFERQIRLHCGNFRQF